MSDELALGMSFDRVLEGASRNSNSKEFKLIVVGYYKRISKDTGASLNSIFDRILQPKSCNTVRNNCLTRRGAEYLALYLL